MQASQATHMGDKGGNFIAMLVLLLLSVTLKFYLSEEHYNLEGFMDEIMEYGRVYAFVQI